MSKILTELMNVSSRLEITSIFQLIVIASAHKNTHKESKELLNDKLRYLTVHIKNGEMCSTVLELLHELNSVTEYKDWVASDILAIAQSGA